MTERRRAIVTEGKTKIIYATNHAAEVELFAKDDMTAFNGKRHELIPGKGAISTTSTRIIFEYLERRGIPTSYMGQVDDRTLLCTRTHMIPLEVVVRQYAAGSILKRYPRLLAGQKLDPPSVEFYLKTKDKQFADVPVPDDDPIILGIDSKAYTIAVFKPDGVVGHLQNEGVEFDAALLDLALGNLQERFDELGKIALRILSLLNEGFAASQCKLLDLKVEFGYSWKDNSLLLADVLDPDSWRLLSPQGLHLDKQPFRNGASVEDTAAIYRDALQVVEHLRAL